MLLTQSNMKNSRTPTFLPQIKPTKNRQINCRFINTDLCRRFSGSKFSFFAVAVAGVQRQLLLSLLRMQKADDEINYSGIQQQRSIRIDIRWMVMRDLQPTRVTDGHARGKREKTGSLALCFDIVTTTVPLLVM